MKSIAALFLLMLIVPCAEGQEEESLLENDRYTLYAHPPHEGAWCNEEKEHVYLSLVLRIGDDVVVTPDDGYRKRFIDAILPVIQERCEAATAATVYNYVEGVRLRGRRVAGRGEALEGSALTIVDVDFSDPDDVKYRQWEPPRSVAGLQAEQEQERKQQAGRDAAQAMRDAERAAHDADREAMKARNAAFAGIDVTTDGKLKLAEISPRFKKLFQHAYAKEFIQLTYADSDYLPYAMFTGLVQAFSDVCRPSLPPHPASVDHISTRYTGSNFGLLMQTHYYERYISKTVYMEPRYEEAYRQAHPTMADKLWNLWISGPNPLPIFFFNSKDVGLIQLDEDAGRLIMNNGCTNSLVKKLIANTHQFITGAWDTKLPDGGYRFAEEEGDHSVLRYYAKVPASFSPAFPLPKTGRMEITLHEAPQPGLQAITIQYLAPMLADAPDAVAGAIEQRKYFVAQCRYGAGGDARSVYYWNANGPLPSAEVQAFLREAIKEPRKSCPAM